MNRSSSMRLFHPHFTLMVIGQIISLFGNAILRFALSLYVLDLTGSAAVFGSILALSMIPTVLVTPLGGVLADRVPRQRIMYVLDFFTAGLLLLYARFAFSGGGVGPVGAMMVVLAAIQALYQPSVQAAVPALSAPEQLLRSNGVVAQVQALSQLLGPILGGFLYGFFGPGPILYVSAACFLFSAVLELFLKIPFTPPEKRAGAIRQIGLDLKDALDFLTREKPALFRMLLTAAALNLLLSALFIVGIPYLIKEHLGLSAQLYGFAEGCLGLGAILGGVLAGALGQRLHIRQATPLLAVAALSLSPLALALLLKLPSLVVYGLTLLCLLVGMASSSLFSILAITFLQSSTPPRHLGKVAAFTVTLSTCALPLGQALYGGFLQAAGNGLWLVFGFSVVSTLAVVAANRKTVAALAEG